MDQNPRDITFVTCFMNIYGNKIYNNRDIAWRIEQFKYIASTGVKICVYGDDITTPFLEETLLSKTEEFSVSAASATPLRLQTLASFTSEFSGSDTSATPPLLQTLSSFPNIKILVMDTPYKETEIYKACTNTELDLPKNRSEEKDTIEYMALMNTKIEFLNDAIQKNPFKSRIFSWIDFNIAYIFGNKDESLLRLRNFTEKKWINTFMAIPGCWNPIPPKNCESIINNIHWRFCGGFFIGDVDSILKFYKLYREHLPIFLKEQKKIVWEVNIWAWLEANTDWKPQWYESDHNDRIIMIPSHFFSET